jgi:peptidoglycan/LPS O-acetylase OafA/YrhL
MIQAMNVRRSRIGSILAAFLAVGAICGISVGLSLVHKGQSPIPSDTVGEWYRDTILALAQGILAAVAASFAVGLRRPIVTPLVGICGLMLLVGLGGLVFPRDPLMPAAMVPGIVAAAIALLVLAIPPVRSHLPD